jgi:ribulose-phosphate 3-epimerase
MDNHYVPNLTFGPMVCQALKPHAKTAAGVAVPIDVHLMVQPVDAWRPRLPMPVLTSSASTRTRPATCTAAFRPSSPKAVKAGLVFNPASRWMCWTG